MAERDEKRRKVSVVFLIVLGLVLGYAMKRVQIGLIIGLALGLLATGLRKR
jgi:uncharacterized membrane protein (UPF0136 family)